jgi:hypothetical protein
MTDAPPRKRGRPRTPDPGSPVCVFLRAPVAARLRECAMRAGTTRSALMRFLVLDELQKLWRPKP